MQRELFDVNILGVFDDCKQPMFICVGLCVCNYDPLTRIQESKLPKHQMIGEAEEECTSHQNMGKTAPSVLYLVLYYLSAV